MIGWVSILLLAWLAATILTGIIRRYALTVNLLDIPNQRSSHTLPTPRGGGLAIVIVFMIGLPVLNGMGFLDQQATWAFLGAGAWVALVGFLDDHQHIPARWRLLAHFVAAVWALVWLGGLPPLEVFGYALDLGWIGHLLGLFYLVWLLNLYNFMDGIDGLAGIEAVTVCLGGVVLYLLTDDSTPWLAPALLAMAVTGFLWWNFPPARIFMGDAGSGFLGIVLGLFSLQATKVSPQFFWSWMILLGVFIVDATWTLFRRLLSGEEVHQAHRSHAYQHASRYFGAHKPVTMWVGTINLCWLTPLALAVGLAKLDGLSGVVLAYFPLVLLAIKFNAGQQESS